MGYAHRDGRRVFMVNNKIRKSNNIEDIKVKL